MLEAMLYQRLDGKAVKCGLCARRCMIQPGKRGVCRVRENCNGTLYTLVYGKAVSYAADPIEKKPLFHFHPGSRAFSIATVGCNFRCNFCDNWVISQEEEILGEDFPPELVVSEAITQKCKSVSYTYTEPTVFFEYAYDTARLARSSGLFNTFVTNGYMTPDAVELIAPYLDAATVDFKGSGDPDFYRELCGVPRVEPIFESLAAMRSKGIHIEITDLIVPWRGDVRAHFKRLARWIVDNLGDETPFHILRFFPSYRYEGGGPSVGSLLEELWTEARAEGLKYVYLGNMPGHARENTCCPSCGEVVIKRVGFEVVFTKLKGDACSYCGKRLNVKV
ncbi:MAG: AmmeMemoRadiSam system radical SAM enzyme [Candidatus Verstraetearchaeota archaeon]|nr:AmmeMemoRadiSam system radical SAM enzyme [Candidatus Verstraetearchaeota archaeon]